MTKLSFYDYVNSETEYAHENGDEKMMYYDNGEDNKDEDVPQKQVGEVIDEFKKFLRSVDIKGKWLVFSEWSMSSDGLSEGVNVTISTETCDIRPIIEKMVHYIRNAQQSDDDVITYSLTYKDDKAEEANLSLEDQKRPFGFEIKVIDPVFPLVMNFKAASFNWGGPY